MFKYILNFQFWYGCNKKKRKIILFFILKWRSLIRIFNFCFVFELNVGNIRFPTACVLRERLKQTFSFFLSTLFFFYFSFTIFGCLTMHEDEWRYLRFSFDFFSSFFNFVYCLYWWLWRNDTYLVWYLMAFIIVHTLHCLWDLNLVSWIKTSFGSCFRYEVSF